MRKLLDSRSQRIIRIMETLMEQNEYITISRLAAAVDAGERTAAKDLTVIRERWNTLLDIENSPSRGVFMHARNTAVLGRVLTDLFNESLALRWIRELFLNPGHDLVYYEEVLFVSQSTLQRLIRQINGCLGGIGAAVSGVGRKYCLVCKNEQYLRQWLTTFMLELCGLNPERLGVELDLELLGGVLYRVRAIHLTRPEDQFALEDDITQIYFMMLYMVSLVRESQGFTQPSDYPAEDEISPEDAQAVLKHFPGLTAASLRPIHEIIASQYRDSNSPEDGENRAAVCRAFSRRVLQDAGIPAGEELVGKLGRVVLCMLLTAKVRPFATSTLFDRIGYFAAAVKRTNPGVSAILEKNFEGLSRDIGEDISLAFPWILYWFCLTCPDLAAWSEQKTALIISDSGCQHSRFLAEFVSGHFNGGQGKKLKLTQAAYPQILFSGEWENYDLVITTIPHLPIRHDRVILVNDYPSYENLCAIYRCLKN